MRSPILVATLLTAILTGCTHQQLDRSTVRATSTVTDIQYRIVLMNLAKLSGQPEALPDHADLADGVVQVNDRMGFGQNGGFTTFTGGRYGFGLGAFGPSGQRQVSEQWGADATTDPQRLVDLQDLYRVALGLEPLPPPNAIAYLRKQQAEERAKSDRKDENKRGSSEKESPKGAAADPSALSPPRVLAAMNSAAQGKGPSSPSSGGGSSGGSEHRRVPIEILLTDVPPPGWFHVGCKEDVPKTACYVGRSGNRYAWVMPDGVGALSRFTVTVLSVVKLKPGEGSKSHGLAFTSGGG
jgi:hypothetical protein